MWWDNIVVLMLNWLCIIEEPLSLQLLWHWLWDLLLFLKTTFPVFSNSYDGSWNIHNYRASYLNLFTPFLLVLWPFLWQPNLASWQVSDESFTNQWKIHKHNLAAFSSSTKPHYASFIKSRYFALPCIKLTKKQRTSK